MRTLTALSLVAATSCAFAQKGVGAPPDVPKNHWAYESVNELYKLGILVGYPNGSFNGSRPASRYEVAVAFANLDRLVTSQLPSLSPNTQSGLSSLRSSLADLQKQLDGMQADKSDLDSLTASMKALKLSLDELRGQTHEMKKTISTLDHPAGKS